MNDLVPPRKHVQEVLFNVGKQVEYDGVEMGVLENGITYLTESGLARMCGIDRKALSRLAVEWEQDASKPRVKAIDDILSNAGYEGDALYLKSVNNGVEINAYPGPVCLAVLEYYAFIAADKKDQALNAYRALARISFDEFIYRAVGYRPTDAVSAAWMQFHDRVDITERAVPFGYFGVFHEIAGMIIPMIKQGVPVGPSIVPDISVGLAWSTHWKDTEGDRIYGERCKYEHNYPDYFDQSKSNPQSPWAYPESALGEFRKWFRETYLPTKYPRYILNLGRKITADTAQKAIAAITGKTLELKKR